MPGLEARTITDGLLAVLDEAVHGASGPSTYFVDNRHDHGLLGSLADLNAGDASRCVDSMSVAAHVHHVVFAMEASTDWMAGDRTPRDWSASWQVGIVDDEAWALLLQRLQQAYGRLRTAIESAAGRDEEAFVEAVGAIAHVAYHLGSTWQKVGALSGAGPHRGRG